MKLKDMTPEDIEQLSYADLAYYVLKENKKGMKVPQLFKKICSILKYSDEQYASKIGDFYTAINSDKRFVSFKDGIWDLRDHHSVKIEVDDDNDEEEDIIEETDEEEMDIEEEDLSEDDNDITDDTEEDDLRDLTIVSDDSEEE